MPDPSVPVLVSGEDSFWQPSYLNDMRSRSGFSGSPVWVWRIPSDDMDMGDVDGHFPERPSIGMERRFLRLLGVHCAQFREEVEITEISSENKRSKAGYKLEIASSMTIVVPAWDITTLLDSPKLEHQRTVRDSRPDRINTSEALVDRV